MYSPLNSQVLKVQKLVDEISTYLYTTTNSDDTDKEPKTKRQKIDSAIESAADKAEHRDTTGEDCIVRSSDSDLECNIVVVEDSMEQFTRYTNKDLEWIRISSILLKKSDKESIIETY